MGNTLIDAVRYTNTTDCYIYQAVPVFGAIVSVPMALYSGAQMIRHAVQAAFKSLSNQSTNLPTTKTQREPQQRTHWDAASDYGILFGNNLANIATAGFLNSIFMMWIVDNVSTHNARGEYQSAGCRFFTPIDQ